MSNHLQIIRLLADGRFHSGQELADRLSVTRAAVWKQLQQIRERHGLEIHAVKGRGYRLAGPLQLLDRDAILSALPASLCVRPAELEILERIDSTNRYLMQKAVQGLANGHVCLAEQQTEGRGRRGRSWVSPFGGNLYLSLYWQYDLEMAALSGLSLAAGVAVAECLQGLGVAEVALKWPNDLHWRERKLGGLLLEVSGEQGGTSRVVLGLGLNLRMEREQGASIDQPWVALSRIPGAAALDRNRVAGQVVGALIGALSQYQREGLSPFVPRWERFDHYLGKAVELTAGDRRVAGIHRGIDPRGALLLETGRGISAHFGGEVSLRQAGP
ncbi:MAG TPA: bifunctional biotin--[acetyl-CoA-carboxylase] ligase/biotin operon repressor BirA [Sedimenticola thiotaurini]|uniref:Bifunctional ligase/repressor BirA n=1 Tax=Sedimenticola thiotaurini TaxID=1543721 RepID=A0A831RQB0_9GAMM|nr:bifunctional biotin--[acetyl-CoA-carboxylase] ligase/biotin operon repressor BirA [Sedimenticola thiotaurini]